MRSTFTESPRGLRRSALRAGGAACLLLLLLPAAAHTHPLAPALLELRQQSAGGWDVTFKLPLVRPPQADARPLLPSWCATIDEPRLVHEADAVRLSWTVDCGARGLDGGRVTVDGLGASGTAALLRLFRSDGAVEQWLLTAENPGAEIGPPREADSPAELARRFAALGARQLFASAEILAVLLALVLLDRSPRSVALGSAGFTVGYSVTLSLLALGLLPRAEEIVDVGLALALLWLAAELVNGEDGLLSRRPWVTALAFGLLCGVPFSAALHAPGAAGADAAVALLGFNAGIEAALLLFTGLVLMSFVAMRAAPPRLLPSLLRVPAYIIGAFAGFWMFDRVAALL